MDDFGFGPIPFVIFGVVFGIACLAVVLKFCCKGCYEACQTSSEEPTQVSQTRPPSFVPAMPSVPPPAPFGDPPPYSEVAFKPNIWPLVDQLPAYDNIAMDPPSMDASQHPRFNAQTNAFGHNF